MADENSAADGNGSTDARSVAENVKEQGQEVAGNAAAKAQEAVRSQVDERSTQAGEQLNSLASDLRSVGDQLREKENEPGAKIASQAAERAEQAGQYLSDADSQKILGDLEDFGRSRPWLALAGGIAIGIAGARFLKASSSQRYNAGTSSQGSTSPTPAAPSIPAQTHAPATASGDGVLVSSEVSASTAGAPV
jgi:ElaB/YqjD/DUF883 family membrane-anchored ribosome-binding protein